LFPDTLVVVPAHLMVLETVMRREMIAIIIIII